MLQMHAKWRKREDMAKGRAIDWSEDNLSNFAVKWKQITIQSRAAQLLHQFRWKCFSSAYFDEIDLYPSLTVYDFQIGTDKFVRSILSLVV